jgi:hypothetical protein
MSKVKKEKVYNFFGLNVKLLSNERKGDTGYFTIMQDLFEKNVIAKIAGEKAMTLRNQFKKKIVWKDVEYDILYGKITRFTLLESKNWYNKKKREFEGVEVPIDVFPNAFETEYYFIPAAHRFFIRAGNKVNVFSVEKFLNRGLNEVTLATEDFSVNVIKSEDAIEQILSAIELKLLKVKVSYTNDDIGKEAQELMDKLLKDGQVGDFEATLRPDQQGTLDTGSNLVKGLLEISRENGTAEASIKDEAGKRRKIITEEYPEKLSVSSPSEDDVISRLFFQIMKSYRDE